MPGRLAMLLGNDKRPHLKRAENKGILNHQKFVGPYFFLSEIVNVDVRKKSSGRGWRCMLKSHATTEPN